MDRFADKGWIHYITRLLLLTVAYAAIAIIILRYFAVNHHVSIIWPSSGIALAGLMLGGYKYFPGIFVGAFFGNLLGGSDNPVWVNLSIATGSTLEVLSAWWVLTAYCKIGNDWESPSDYFYLGVVGSLSSSIAAFVGVISLYVSGVLSGDVFLTSVLRWWQGDILGLILVGPLITLIASHKSDNLISKNNYLSIVFCFFLTFLLGQSIFIGWFQEWLVVYAKPFWIFPLITWAAVAFGRRGVLLLVCMVMIQALMGIFSGVNLPYYPDLSTVEIKLKSLWIFLIALIIVGMAPALIIHARRRMETDLQESEERWKFALEGVGDGVWDWHINSKKIILSPVFIRMYGHYGDTVEAYPEAWSALVHPDDMSGVLADFQNHLSGKTPYYQNEHRVQCADGTYKWILDRGMVVRYDKHGNPLRMVGTHSDISERKLIDQQLLDAYATLETRVTERTKQLDDAKQMAEAATMAKTEFLANMSHEIRTPISGMLGLSHLALSTSLDEKQRDYLEKIQRAGKQLLVLVDDVLDFSRLDAGKMQLDNSEFELLNVVDSVKSIFAYEAEEKGLEFQLDIDTRIDTHLYGDPVRLEQILSNYLSNAIKFSHKGKVTLRVLAVAGSSNDCLLRFEVIDQGVGVTPEVRKMLFSSFHQGDMSKRKQYGGTGLGLAICKKLASLMNGETGFESQVGKGSTFWVTVRLGRLNAMGVSEDDYGSNHRSTDVSSLPLSGTRILLVEDNLFNQQVAKELLELAGASVMVAGNGLEALEILKDEELFDAVLMDIQMPLMDGLTATREIRANPLIGDSLIIAMTANTWEKDRDQCLAEGMNDFLSKPFRPAEMISKLDSWLSCNIDQPLDMKVLSSLYDGDPVKTSAIVNKFLILSRADITAMYEGLRAGNLETVRQLGHKMQSGARQLGAVKFAELCHWLEHELPSETPWLGYARIRQLERILAQIAQQMQLNG